MHAGGCSHQGVPLQRAEVFLPRPRPPAPGPLEREGQRQDTRIPCSQPAGPCPHLPFAPHGKPWPSPALPPPPKAFLPQGPPYSTIPPVLKAAFSPGGQGYSPKGKCLRHRSQKVLAFACWGHQYNIPGSWESAVLCGCPEDLPWGGWTEDPTMGPLFAPVIIVWSHRVAELSRCPMVVGLKFSLWESIPLACILAAAEHLPMRHW